MCYLPLGIGDWGLGKVDGLHHLPTDECLRLVHVGSMVGTVHIGRGITATDEVATFNMS